MTIKYITQFGNKNIEVVNREDIADANDICSLDQICREIAEAWDNLPEPLKKRKVISCSYYGDIGSIIVEYYISKRYICLANMDFFKDNEEEFEIPEQLMNLDKIFIDSGAKEKWPSWLNTKEVYKLKDLIEAYTKDLMIKNYGIRIIDLSETQMYWQDDRTDYVMNSIFGQCGEEGMSNKAKAEYDKFSDELLEYESKYVPGSGPAKTIFGEVLRACQRVVYRFFNDGECCDRVTDGNLLSYTNIPYILKLALYDAQEESEYLCKEVQKLYHEDFPSWDITCIKDIADLFYGADVKGVCIINSIRLEKALIETRKAYPKFLEGENNIDSRKW